MVLLVACGTPAPTKTAPPPTGTLDQLLAPIALYPDPLLAQMLMSATNPSKVTELDKWLKSNTKLKGTQLQDAAVKAGFDASFVALVLFPQVVSRMAEQIAWTRVLGQTFESDRSAVFASIQKLRKQAQSVGTLKTTPQQKVETKKTSAGEQVIVIEPANPQVVYVPQYNTEVVYTQAPTTTVIIQEEDDDDAAEAIAAGLIGFTAGIAIGAAMDNHYYYGPYGWHGGAYMYNDAWDDYYDEREDAREDWMDHREDLVEERSDRLEDQRENRSDRVENTQQQRTDRQETRQENRPETRPETAAGKRGRKLGQTRRPNEQRGQRRRQAPRHRARAGVVLQPRKLAVRAARPGLSRVVNEPARTRSRATRAAHLNAPPAPGDSKAEQQQRLARRRLTWRGGGGRRR